MRPIQLQLLETDIDRIKREHFPRLSVKQSREIMDIVDKLLEEVKELTRQRDSLDANCNLYVAQIRELRHERDNKPA
jgi:uncharacterized coiled-coil DUF342 family protein